jgi:hypothetical protein
MGAFIANYRETDSSPAITFNHDSELEKTGNVNGFEAGYALDYKDGNKQASLASDENARAQLVAVAVLEFGIILHRHVLLRPILFHAN